MKLFRFTTLVLSPIVFLCSFGTVADTLIVTATDSESARPIKGVTIRVIDRADSEQISTGENDGVARITSLDQGLYEVIVSSEGYNTVRLPSVRIITGKASNLEVKLTKTLNDIEQTIVVGQSRAGDNLDPASASIIDRESLRSAAGSGSDVLRALDGLPGLFSDGEFSSFTVRGNGPRNNLILVDGVPFDRVVHFSNSFGELDDVESGGRFSVFAPNIVGGAEFQPGGWSAAYGGQAGSLLKLEVAEGNPESPSFTTRLDLAGIELGYDGPSYIHDDTSVLFSARQLNFGRIFELVGVDDFGEPKITDIILKTSTKLGDSDQLKFLVLYAPETFSRDVDNVLASDEDGTGEWEDLELTETDNKNSLFVATWNRLIGENAELTNRIYLKDYSEFAEQGEALPFLVSLDANARDVPTRFPIITSKNDEKEFGWRLDYASDNALGRMEAGVRFSSTDLLLSRELDGNWIRYEYDQTDFRPLVDQKFIELTPDTVNTRLEDTTRRSTVYVEQSLSLGSIDMRVGGRYEHDSLLDDSLVSPRFSANWQNQRGLSLTLTAGRYSQSPQFSDIASDINNQLTYEINDQLSLGLKYRFDSDIELFIEPYLQKLSDLAVNSDTVNQTYASTGEGDAIGFDTAITRYFSNGWSANATYSYNRTRLKDTPDGLEYDADYSRPHAFTIGGTWELSERWKISGRIKWASGLPFDDFIVNENVLGDGQELRFSKERISNNTERYDSYSSVNMRVDYRRSIGPADVIAFFDVINLLGSENTNDTDFNELTGENTIDDGEPLPLFGFRLEW